MSEMDGFLQEGSVTLIPSEVYLSDYMGTFGNVKSPETLSRYIREMARPSFPLPFTHPLKQPSPAHAARKRTALPFWHICSPLLSCHLTSSLLPPRLALVVASQASACISHTCLLSPLPPHPLCQPPPPPMPSNTPLAFAARQERAVWEADANIQTRMRVETTLSNICKSCGVVPYSAIAQLPTEVLREASARVSESSCRERK